jgi:hypothetical protein
MTTNQEVLERAQSCAQRFEATQEASWLESAWDAIQDVAWTQESSATARGAVRTRSLDMWLHLLDLLDKYLDPNFDENAKFENSSTMRTDRPLPTKRR